MEYTKEDIISYLLDYKEISVDFLKNISSNFDFKIAIFNIDFHTENVRYKFAIREDVKSYYRKFLEIEKKTDSTKGIYVDLQNTTNKNSWISIIFTYPDIKLLYILNNQDSLQDIPHLIIPDYLGIK